MISEFYTAGSVRYDCVSLYPVFSERWKEVEL
jgi:hypothetical protein